MPAARPNILIILDDQHRWDYIGHMGAAFVNTPTIDSIAERGVAFTQCCTNSPICAPARIALATGLMPTRTGCLTNADCLPISLPNHYRHFRDHGYRVELVGRHDLSKPRAPDSVHGNRPLNFSYGFTRALEIEGGMAAARDVTSAGGKPTGPYSQYLAERGLLERYSEDFMARRSKGWIIGASHDSVLETEDHQDSYVGTQAVKRLELLEHDFPWFMFVSFQGPHDPFDPPTEFADRCRHRAMPPPIPADSAGKPDRTRQRQTAYATATDADILLARRQYAAKIELIDTQIGRILAALEQRGELDNTIIVFASDHGEMLGDHGLFIKHVAYEPSMRVPLCLCGPGIQPGRSDALVELFDLNPTLVELAGLPAQAGLDANSFASVLHSPGEAHRDHCVTVEQGYAAIRTERWKYIDTWNQQPELYDLQADPEERHNLLPGADDQAATLARRLTARLRISTGVM